jgi:NADH-quinone oxidoreductase subunit J
MITAAAFYLFSAVLLGSAAMVITSRNPVHSVLFLILAFFNAAGLFLLSGAEFLALILVIVYVGAVAVLFLFVVMMLDVNFAELRHGFQRFAPVGAAVGAALLAELAVSFGGWHFAPAAGALRLSPTPATLQNTVALGRLIYTDYIFLFQASGLILLVAMIGAIVLTHRERHGSTKRQVIAEQVGRKVADTMVVVKVPIGAGMKDLGIYRKLATAERKSPALAHHGHDDAHDHGSGPHAAPGTNQPASKEH